MQDNHELLSRCIKEDLGFKGAKPVAACIIYKCLLHWHAFEAERTTIFDYIIEGINDVLKVLSLVHSNRSCFDKLGVGCLWAQLFKIMFDS